MDTTKPGGEAGEGTESLYMTDDAVELYMQRIEEPELFPQEETIVERYFTESDASVLDVGCGVGRVSHLLDERGFDVTGIEISEPLLEKARSLFPELSFRHEDIRETTFESKTFDYVVFSFFGLDNILPKAEREAALREMYRVLKPAGIVMFSSHNSWYKPHRRTVGNLMDRYLRGKERRSIFSRSQFEGYPLGEMETYYSNPLHQWLQLRKCGFTLLDIVGEQDGYRRFFEQGPHYVAKK